MSAQKGSNGIQDGQRNVEIFCDWVATVTDFRPFVHQGLLSISRMASESGLNRDVFYSNSEIRETQLPSLIRRLESDGVLQSRVANPGDGVQRQRTQNRAGTARIKQIQEENEAVKSENRELRRRLDKLKTLEGILHSTGRLPW